MERLELRHASQRHGAGRCGAVGGCGGRGRVWGPWVGVGAVAGSAASREAQSLPSTAAPVSAPQFPLPSSALKKDGTNLFTEPPGPKGSSPREMCMFLKDLAPRNVSWNKRTLGTGNLGC